MYDRFAVKSICQVFLISTRWPDMSPLVFSKAKINNKSIFVWVVIFSIFLRYYFSSVAFGAVVIVLSALFFITICRSRLVVDSNEAIILFLLLSCVFMAAVNSFFKDPRGMYYAVLMLCSFLFAFGLRFFDPRSFLKICRMSLFLYLVFFVASGVHLGFSHDKVNSYFPDASRNIVSAFAIFLQILYSTAYYNVYSRLPRITPFLVFLVCFVSYGRTGVVLSFLILLITAIDFLMTRRRAARFALMLSILAVFFYLISSYGVVFDFIETSTNLARGVESPRFQKMYEYISSQNLTEVVSGRHFELSPTIMQYGGNPHNSFILGHHYMGLPYLFLVAYVILSSTYYALISLGNIYIFLFLQIAFVRVFFDIISFPGLFDFVIFYIYFSLSAHAHSGLLAGERPLIAK